MKSHKFSDLAFGARFEDGSKKTYVKIDYNVIAEWDSDKIADSWHGQKIYPFDEDADEANIGRKVYVIEEGGDEKTYSPSQVLKIVDACFRVIAPSFRKEGAEEAIGIMRGYRDNDDN